MSKENEENEARSFTHFLATLGSGEAVAELARELHSITKSLHDESRARNGKVKGSLALTISFECSKEQIVGITYAVKAKRPDPQRSSTIAWATSAGHLTPQNPRQQKLALHDVKSPQQAIRDLEEQGIDPVTFREVNESETQ